MKTLKIILAMAVTLGLAAACSNSKTENTDNKGVAPVEKMEAKPAKSLKSAAGLPMVVDFSATWCPPCQKLRPTFEALKKEYAGSVDLLNVDGDAHEDLVQEYEVQAYPTLVFLDPQGRELSRSVGYVSEDELRDMIEELLAQER